MELPVSQISQSPRESRLFCEADPTFVLYLKQKTVNDPSAPGATPMAVLCKDIEQTTKFNTKHNNVYKSSGGAAHYDCQKPAYGQISRKSIFQGR